ncbi:hypothetical protein [Amycolatopsis taiwanensis]|nr:hypothetical protein [Amycolatopsis taiwanensis]
MPIELFRSSAFRLLDGGHIASEVPLLISITPRRAPKLEQRG